MSYSAALRFWQTVRWLKPRQIWGRAWFKLAKPKVAHRAPPAFAFSCGIWIPPARRRPSLIGPGRLFFLNEAGDIQSCGWDDPARDKLWRYNLHYFDDLNAASGDTRWAWHQALLADWLIANPLARGGTGWEPYPISLRIVNWIKWMLGGGPRDPALISSLATQARVLAKKLEIHLLGNHLFANAKALIFAGLFFTGPEAQTWRQRGFRIVERETREQILDDGGQFELSPMYHALALEDVLDLINLCRRYADALSPAQHSLVARWVALAGKMRLWLQTMTHPDKEIAFFNDAAFGVAPSPEQLEDYANALGLPAIEPKESITHLLASGYVRLEQGVAVLLCDIARVGPDYLPGHAHADTLSFELSLFGQRVIVNSGTSTYELGSERLRQRGTRAHNTVALSGHNSSDVWSSFRVGRRARPLGMHSAREGDSLVAEAAHDGYRHMPGRPIHHRRWELMAGGLHIIDKLPDGPYEAEARYHLHPGVTVHLRDDHSGQLGLANGRIVHWAVAGGSASIEQSTWHPEFGRSVRNECLVLSASDGCLRLNLRWDETDPTCISSF